MTDKFKGWYPDYIENEKEREPILKLAKMMTGRAKKKLGLEKMTKYDPEYWGLALLCTDEQAEIALKMGMRQPKTLDQMVKVTGKDRGYLEKQLEEMAEGTKVNVTSTKNSEWYAVTTASGQKGYVFSEYLNVTGTVNEDDSSDSGSSDNSNTGTNGEAAKTTTGVHLRSGKGTNYSSLGVIPGGTAITVTDKSDVWYAVTVNGKSGYMYSEYIKLTGTGSSDNNTSSGSTDGSASAQTNEDVHLREGRGTNYRSLGVIANGTAITVTDTSVSDWYGVTVNGKSGYMFSEYITMNGSNSGSTDSSASSDTMRTTAYLNLRSGTGTDTNVLTVIPEGASVTVLEKTTSEWYKVSYGSRTGYVFTEYLK